MKEKLFWRGKAIEEYTKEELIEIIGKMAKMLKEGEERQEKYLRLLI